MTNVPENYALLSNKGEDSPNAKKPRLQACLHDGNVEKRFLLFVFVYDRMLGQICIAAWASWNFLRLSFFMQTSTFTFTPLELRN